MAAPAEVVHRAVDALTSGDMEAFSDCFSDDVVTHIPGRSRVAGDYAGKQAVLGYFGQLMELSGGTFGADVHDIVGNDDHAVGIYNLSADRDGQHGEWHWVNVYHVRDDRIIEYWGHVVDQYSFDQFWS
jgi:ketosteroid isomerase-like protein